ncbi:hypothetical protein DEJ28_00505 [Curtobacterium sp. MCPF17_002]|uniref:hypothetical protein n=1 Tax=Curtobacterium sp. MCPF17_002 TaxID=2175645 RepID=UPI000DA7B02B|nr:hypothetical protein [Curtobacterium sp. MCPF17_002]WIB77609.1 hypothetical protein DEJ28_00505 [Curtobacterium sp. MCPF17_002]
MFKPSRRVTASTLVAVTIAGALAFGTPAVAASAAPIDDDNHVTTIGETTVSSTTAITTQAQLTAFEQSATPKVITIDPSTNVVESVTETTEAAQLRGVTNGCASGALCWQAAQVPYANFGFSVAGTYTGAWEWRGTMKSNTWGGQLTYTVNNSGASSTTPVFGRNSEIKFTKPTTNNIKGLKVLVRK